MLAHAAGILKLTCMLALAAWLAVLAALEATETAVFATLEATAVARFATRERRLPPPASPERDSMASLGESWL